MTTNVPGEVTSIPESWSAWADGACTKPCDYGTQSGSRQCLQETCYGNSMRKRVCNSFNCDGKWQQADPSQWPIVSPNFPNFSKA